MRPVTFLVAAFLALLLQAVLPLKIPLARLFEFPLLVTVYFALLRRNKIFGIGLGTGLGLLQDALSHGYIGISGMAKALVGYLAASAGVKFDLEELLPRTLLLGSSVLVHSLCVFGLQRALLEYAPSFQPLNLLSTVLVNLALGLIVFQVLDRFRRPA